MLGYPLQVESNQPNNANFKYDPVPHNSIPSLANSSFSTHKIPQTNLSDKQIEALLNAQSRYHIQILEKTIDNHRKTLVLFGETHVTDEIGQIQAKSIFARFPHRAMEGIDATNYPFASAYSALLKKREKEYSSGIIPGMTMPGAIDLSTRHFTEESEAITQLFAKLSSAIDTYLMAFQEGSAQKPLIVHINELNINLPQERIEAILVSLFSNAQSTISEKLENLAILPPFSLENYHQPTGTEKLEVGIDLLEDWLARQLDKTFVAATILGGTLINLASLAGLAFSSSIIPKISFLLTTPMATTFMAATIIAQILPRIPEIRELHAIIREKLETGSMASRDNTLSLEANRLITSNPVITDLLLQVGKRHVPGVSKNLQKKDWRQIFDSKQETESCDR